jgi:hypothetical protein
MPRAMLMAACGFIPYGLPEKQKQATDNAIECTAAQSHFLMVLLRL